MVSEMFGGSSRSAITNTTTIAHSPTNAARCSSNTLRTIPARRYMIWLVRQTSHAQRFDTTLAFFPEKACSHTRNGMVAGAISLQPPSTLPTAIHRRSNAHSCMPAKMSRRQPSLTRSTITMDRRLLLPSRTISIAPPRRFHTTSIVSKKTISSFAHARGERRISPSPIMHTSCLKHSNKPMAIGRYG